MPLGYANKINLIPQIKQTSVSSLYLCTNIYLLLSLTKEHRLNA